MLDLGFQLDSLVYTYVIDHVYSWFILTPGFPKRNYFVIRGASVKCSCPCVPRGEIFGTGGLALNLGSWWSDWSASCRGRSTAMEKINPIPPEWVSQKQDIMSDPFPGFLAHILVTLPNVLYFTRVHVNILKPRYCANFVTNCWKIERLVGRSGVVGIATRFTLDGPGIEYRWERDLRYPSRPALVPTQPLQWEAGLFPGVRGRGVALTTHPHLSPRLKKEYSYTCTPLGLHGPF
jgi:hypothetical protein